MVSPGIENYPGLKKSAGSSWPKNAPALTKRFAGHQGRRRGKISSLTGP
jgi:hypothetical protein